MNLLGKVLLWILLLHNGSCLSVTPLCMERLQLVRECVQKVDDAIKQFEQRFGNEKIVLRCGHCTKISDFNDIVFMLTLLALQGAVADGGHNFEASKTLLEETGKIFLQGSVQEIKTFMLTTAQASTFACLECKHCAWQIADSVLVP